MLLNVPSALEYEALCRKADHRLAAGLKEQQVEIFLDAVIAMVEPVETHFLWRPNSAILTMKWCWRRRSMDGQMQ
jgi:hypothetical protein